MKQRHAWPHGTRRTERGAARHRTHSLLGCCAAYGDGVGWGGIGTPSLFACPCSFAGQRCTGGYHASSMSVAYRCQRNARRVAPQRGHGSAGAHLERGVCAVVSVIVPQTQMISLGHVCGVVPLRRRRAVPRSPPRLAVPAGKLLETVSPVLAFLRIRKEVAVAARASPGPLSAPTLVTAHGARAWVDGVAHARDPAACASAHARLPPVCALGAAPPVNRNLRSGKKGRNLPRTSLPAVVNRHHVRCTSYCCDPAAPQSTNSKPDPLQLETLRSGKADATNVAAGGRPDSHQYKVDATNTTQPIQ